MKQENGREYGFGQCDVCGKRDFLLLFECSSRDIWACVECVLEAFTAAARYFASEVMDK